MLNGEREFFSTRLSLARTTGKRTPRPVHNASRRRSSGGCRQLTWPLFKPTAMPDFWVASFAIFAGGWRICCREELIVVFDVAKAAVSAKSSPRKVRLCKTCREGLAIVGFERGKARVVVLAVSCFRSQAASIIKVCFYQRRPCLGHHQSLRTESYSLASTRRIFHLNV